MLVITGDIGGTRSRLQLLKVDGSGTEALAYREYANGDFPSFDAVAEKFLADTPVHDAPRAACLGVAGPVIDSRVKLTNLPWSLSADSLAELFHTPAVYLINDLEAAAWGVDTLSRQDKRVLQDGSPDPAAPGAVIGVGTGFGQAMFTGNGDTRRVFVSEGGHADFAPTDQTAVELLLGLWRKQPQVSVETVLSGEGLERIYGFLHNGNWHSDSPVSASVITHLAGLGNPKARKAVDLFLGLLGSQVANVAISYVSLSGIYLTGGVLAAMESLIVNGTFLLSFHNKPAVSSLLKRIPIHLVTDTGLGLRGAAGFLRQRLAPDGPAGEANADLLYSRR